MSAAFPPSHPGSSPFEVSDAQLRLDLLRMARVAAISEVGVALAHELNQPLTALALYLQAALTLAEKQRTPLPDEIRALIDKAIREADRASGIVQRMRQLAAADQMTRQRIAVGFLMDEAVNLVLVKSLPGMRIRREGSKNLPYVLVDPVHITQALVTLLQRALGAAGGQNDPQIVFGARQRDAQVFITVRDNGPAIPPESVPDLFKAFTRSSEADFGLSLAICRSIAQSHGGDVTLDKSENGLGTLFTLRLPVA